MSFCVDVFSRILILNLFLNLAKIRTVSSCILKIKNTCNFFSVSVIYFTFNHGQWQFGCATKTSKSETVSEPTQKFGTFWISCGSLWMCFWVSQYSMSKENNYLFINKNWIYLTSRSQLTSFDFNPIILIQLSNYSKFIPSR